MRIEVGWVEGMEFRAETESGHTLTMDVSQERGGNDLGARPTELLLSAVGGCKALTLSAHQKMQQPVEGLGSRYQGSGGRPPPPLPHIKLHYIVSGKGLTEDRVAEQCSLQ